MTRIERIYEKLWDKFQFVQKCIFVPVKRNNYVLNKMLIDQSSWQEGFSVVKAKKTVNVVKEYARSEVTSKGH